MHFRFRADSIQLIKYYMEYPMLSITVHLGFFFRLNIKLKDTQGTESVMEKVFRSFNIKILQYR